MRLCSMKKKLFILGICLFFGGLAFPVFASNICAADPCTTSDVGVFMDGISQSCGNTGDCSMDDIMQVFYNVGNYILAIAGSLVLLMYVIGGVLMISSRGNGTQVQKGIKFIEVSTIGLIIVFIAYAGVKTLENVLQGGSTVTTDQYADCGEIGNTHEGEPCGEYKRCSESGICTEECQLKNLEVTSEVFTWQCVDTNLEEYTDIECVTDLCSGGTNIKCCNVLN